jgi:N-acetylglutamate synthase-like GNAT family acetyltransferase/SAM-dependent methyltransferase
MTRESKMSAAPARASEFVVRPARLPDLEAVFNLLATVKLCTEGVREGFGESYAIAERDGALAGLAGIEVHGRWGLLRSVAVSPLAQKAGLGAALVRDRLAWAEARGLAGVYLLTTTAPDYFRRLGFEAIERSAAPVEIQASREFSSACPATAVVMYMPLPESGRWLRESVRQKYAAAALSVQTDRPASCGPLTEGDSACGCITNPITRNLYETVETQELPAEAVLASLGCGNPAALAELKPGENVLDLGSGGGIDVLLSAKRVAPTGTAYGLDMTEEMLALARENQQKAGIKNAEFLKGEIENIPLPSSSLDVIISNCVINLSADKDRVLREAFRVLKPGGRFAVSDVVVRGGVPSEIRRSIELWAGCVAGALEESEYRSRLAAAGFEGIEIEPTRVYHVEDARQLLTSAGLDVDAIAPLVDGKFMSAFVRARKPRGS